MARSAELRRYVPEPDVAEEMHPEAQAPTLIRADAGERMLGPTDAPLRFIERRRLAILFGAFLLLHAGLLVLMFAVLGFRDDLTPEQEIAVELVPPPEQQAPPPPPEQPPEQQKPPEKEAQKQPPPPLDLKTATDAPRAPTKETVERDAPDKETKAQQKEQPSDPGTAGPTPDKAQEAKSVPAPEQGPATEKTAPDKPDAETVEQAQNKPDVVQRFTSPEPKQQNGAAVPTIAQMMARLEPIPDYKLAGAAAPVPVSGGTAKPNYLSILYGMIMPVFRSQRPPGKRVAGKIVLYIDTTGHILHQGVLQPSGSPAVDAIAMASVKRAAPFPPPPGGLPAVIWTYE